MLYYFFQIIYGNNFIIFFINDSIKLDLTFNLLIIYFKIEDFQIFL